MSYRWIRASEISEYVYCNRAWWLKRVRGFKSSHVQEMQIGRQHHKLHGLKVRRMSRMRKLAYIFIFLVVAWAVFQLLIGLM